MNLGLIARATERGLGIQTRENYRHLNPARTLVVTDVGGRTNQGHDEHREWYPDATFLPSLEGHTLDETAVRDWIDGLDVVMSVETPYDWRLPNWARAMKSRTVIHGNPEFYKHHLEPSRAHPDAWWWPTRWLIDRLPAGPMVPVPMPDDAPVTAADPGEGPLTVVHTVGRRAHADRAGTIPFMKALAIIRERIHVRIYSQDGSVPKPTLRRNVTVEVVSTSVPDRWAMYAGAHVMIHPRRYGGLNLPALEAFASGLAVAMPDCSPNWAWPIIPLDCRMTRMHLPVGDIDAADVSPHALAAAIDRLAADRSIAANAQRAAREWAVHNRWSVLLPDYEAGFRAVAGQ